MRKKHKKRLYLCVSSNKRWSTRKSNALCTLQQALAAIQAEGIQQVDVDDEHHGQRRKHGRVENLAKYAIVYAVLSRCQVAGMWHVVGTFHTGNLAARL